MATKVKKLTIVKQNGHTGIYTNNKKVTHIGSGQDKSGLYMLEFILTEANIKYITIDAPHIPSVMLPDDLQLLLNSL